MKFVELRMLHQDVKADHVVKAGWLATLPRDMSKVLENLVMPPILEIPLDPHMAGDVLEVVAVILKHLKEAYDSDRCPRDYELLANHHRHRRPPCLGLLLCFCFIFLMSHIFETWFLSCYRHIGLITTIP
jgi:hypothetical protein